MMRSIAYNYAGFQELPKGIKKMLVVTESHFFGEQNGRLEPEVKRLAVHFPPSVAMRRTPVAVAAAWAN
jgi:hypothetical protein